ncbi:hypothetical protein D3C79_865930 [compost metagenome]
MTVGQELFGDLAVSDTFLDDLWIVLCCSGQHQCPDLWIFFVQQLVTFHWFGSVGLAFDLNTSNVGVSVGVVAFLDHLIQIQLVAFFQFIVEAARQRDGLADEHVGLSFRSLSIIFQSSDLLCENCLQFHQLLCGFEQCFCFGSHDCVLP